MDEHDIEWRCDCGHLNPDFDEGCNECREARYPDNAEATSPAQTGLAAITAGQEDEPSQPVNDTSSDRK